MFVQNFLAYYILATDLQSQYRSESVKICDMAVRRHFAPGRIAKYCKKICYLQFPCIYAGHSK